MNPEINTGEKGFKLSAWLRQKMDALNMSFNQLSLKTKKFLVIATGMLIAMTCLMIILQAFQLGMSVTTKPESITTPNDIFMKAPAQKFTLIGKLKGEMIGEFKVIHVAIDHEGQLFINPNPDFSKDSLNKEKDWEPITKEQLNQYEKQLRFIPLQKKGVKR